MLHGTSVKNTTELSPNGVENEECVLRAEIAWLIFIKQKQQKISVEFYCKIQCINIFLLFKSKLGTKNILYSKKSSSDSPILVV